MMTRELLARCAPLAIAVTAALPATPALAQDAATADPVIVLPSVDTAPVAPAPAPAPTIVLPQTEPVAAPSANVSSVEVDEPAARPARAAPTRAATTRAQAPTLAATREPSASTPAREPAAVPISPSLNAADTDVSAPVATTRADTTAADGTDEALVAGMLGALGLASVGGIAYAASRRRRRARHETAVAHEPVAAMAVSAERPMAAPPAAPVAQRTVTDPVAQSNVTMDRAISAPRVSGDPVPLPAEVPQTFEERDALLKELVAAKPDRANPFTSVRARARRAKLIMQSLGEDFSNRKPRIDLSQYTNRWPALRGWQPATS
jgi:hypothetical protein